MVVIGERCCPSYKWGRKTRKTCLHFHSPSAMIDTSSYAVQAKPRAVCIWFITSTNWIFQDCCVWSCFRYSLMYYFPLTAAKPVTMGNLCHLGPLIELPECEVACGVNTPVCHAYFQNRSRGTFLSVQSVFIWWAHFWAYSTPLIKAAFKLHSVSVSGPPLNLLTHIQRCHLELLSGITDPATMQPPTEGTERQTDKYRKTGKKTKNRRTEILIERQISEMDGWNDRLKKKKQWQTNKQSNKNKTCTNCKKVRQRQKDKTLETDL